MAPERAILGDLNAELIATYQVLRDKPAELAELVHAWPHDSETYYEIREWDSNTLAELEAAARFVYLNRLCFNGVYRTNRLGKFNVPYGRRTGGVPERHQFEACAELLRSAVLRAGDFEAAVQDVGEGDFVYLDPPYSRAVSDAYGVYGYGSFDGADLDRLLECVRGLHRRGARVLLSYTWDTRLAKLGKSWDIAAVAVRSQVGGAVASRSTRREVLVANYALSSRRHP